MTYRITIELDADPAEHDVPGLALWIGHAVTKEGALGIVVTRVDVEQVEP